MGCILYILFIVYHEDYSTPYLYIKLPYLSAGFVNAGKYSTVELDLQS